MPDVWIITGAQNSGKSVMMLDIMRIVQDDGIPICGLVSPGVYENGERIAIQVLDIETGERVILADLKPGWDPDNPNKKWKMREENILWGNEHLQKIRTKGKIYFLDEIGIYELLDGKGWQRGLQILQEKDFKHAVVAVRKEVLTEAIQICEKAQISIEIVDLDALPTQKQEIINIISNRLME
ncbi:MAG: hypothetical protein C4545_00715 [Anaerolineaceae bacterium]|jgi:nucleoside-triphosphatase THEP1|nr:MAG: hypothetical protein C4545_00715 [Anaerolineaceae bacterium]